MKVKRLRLLSDCDSQAPASWPVQWCASTSAAAEAAAADGARLRWWWEADLPGDHGTERRVVVPDVLRRRLVGDFYPRDAIRSRDVEGLRVEADHEVRQRELAEVVRPVEQLLHVDRGGVGEGRKDCLCSVQLVDCCRATVVWLQLGQLAQKLPPGCILEC